MKIYYYSRKIAEAFGSTGMEYFNTFGGNAVSCSISNAVLDVIQDESLMSHAIEMGNYLTQGFQKLQQKHNIIGNTSRLYYFKMKLFLIKYS